MKIDEIKAQIVRQATIFETGGVRPTYDLLESWIGSVRWSLSRGTFDSGISATCNIVFNGPSFCAHIPAAY